MEGGDGENKGRQPGSAAALAVQRVAYPQFMCRDRDADAASALVVAFVPLILPSLCTGKGRDGVGMRNKGRRRRGAQRKKENSGKGSRPEEREQRKQGRRSRPQISPDHSRFLVNEDGPGSDRSRIEPWIENFASCNAEYESRNRRNVVGFRSTKFGLIAPRKLEGR